MKGKIVTVLGEIEPEEAGITLPHEHIFVDARSWCVEPDEMTLKTFFHSKVTISLLGRIRYDPVYFLDNMVLDDIDAAIEELKQLKAAGGKTLVSLTMRGLGRDPTMLVRVARETGLNIIMGTGLYRYAAHPPDVKEKDIDAVGDDFVRDITEGVGPDKVRAGIIGEIGISNEGIHPEEEKVLRASARAQRKTGAAISIHPGLDGGTEMDIVKILEEEGADLNRVIMGHQDVRYPLRDDKKKLKLHETLAKRGIYCQYDQWGAPWDLKVLVPDRRVVGTPPDYERVYAVRHLIERGCIERLLFSQDVCCKIHLAKYGGFGYTHVVEHVPKMMVVAGVSEEEVRRICNTILVENPKRVLTFS